jgi:hypothetical protein
MKTPTPEQVARLPKWAQAHIADLDRQCRVAITALEYFQDSDEPTMVSYEQLRCLDGKTQFFTRHIDAHEVTFTAAGVSLVVRLPDDSRGIQLSWGPEGGHGLGDMCFTPTSYQQARITNLAYMPHEYESLLKRKRRAEENDAV